MNVDRDVDRRDNADRFERNRVGKSKTVKVYYCFGSFGTSALRYKQLTKFEPFIQGTVLMFEKILFSGSIFKFFPQRNFGKKI